MGEQEALGAQIGAARRAKGMTQQQLADVVGVDRKTVNRWENGRTGGLGANYAKLAEVLGLPADQALRMVQGEPVIFTEGPGEASFLQSGSFRRGTAIGPPDVDLGPVAVDMAFHHPQPAFELDPSEHVEVTDLARRLSWLQAALPPEQAVQLAAVVEAAMALAWPDIPERPSRRADVDMLAHIAESGRAGQLREPRGEDLPGARKRDGVR